MDSNRKIGKASKIGKNSMKEVNRSITRSSRAGIIFPVSRIQRYLKFQRD